MPNLFHYGAWDGTQHVLDLDAESLLDAMSDDLLEEGDLWRALQRLFRQGAQNQNGQKVPGLQDLLQQLRQRRQQQSRHVRARFHEVCASAVMQRQQKPGAD